MKDIIIPAIITLCLIALHFLSETLISYWKYLLPKKKYTYLFFCFSIVAIMSMLIYYTH